MKFDNLGDRCKAYEVAVSPRLTKKVPVLIRIDGKAFHTWTRGMERPFCQDLIDSMYEAAVATALDIQGCKAVYVQSDEATFLITDYEEEKTDSWFGYKKSKMESISASMMTANFYKAITSKMDIPTIALFDSRAFNVPKGDVANAFLWRMKDWQRNSLSMYGSEFFSQKELHGKKRADQHELLHSVGKNWATDLSPQIKNGSLWTITEGDSFDTLPHYINIYEKLKAFL